MMRFYRRQFLAGGLAFTMTGLIPAIAKTVPSIHVIKGRGCGCCNEWARILKAEGFAVTEEERLPADLVQFKIANGIPQNLQSCHTALIDGFFIEGHVPVADIYRLVSERPSAIGLAVPGMPYGSPGMGPETAREAYEVFLLNKDGSHKVFSSYEAAS